MVEHLGQLDSPARLAGQLQQSPAGRRTDQRPFMLHERANRVQGFGTAEADVPQCLNQRFTGFTQQG